MCYLLGIRSALHQVLRRHSLDPAPRDPWYFPSTEDYQEESLSLILVRTVCAHKSNLPQLLEKHGFRVCHISLNPRITPLKGNVKDWVNVFCKGNFLRDVDDEEAKLIMEEVNDLCAVDCCDLRGRWSMMYTRLRVVAVYE